MSYRPDKILSLRGVDFSQMSLDQLKDLFKDVLESGIHGLCYSAYERDQKPGDVLTIEQIRRRMSIMGPHTKWVRSFSCIEGNEIIPVVAKEFGCKNLVGAWLGDDKELNEKEIEGLIRLAKEGYVDIAAVGNEVLLRGDLSADELLDYLNRVKKAAPDIPISYVDAYYEFELHPNIANACDVILANCYPFWEGCHIEYSLLYMKDMYRRAQKAAPGKKVIISETGWPNNGSDTGGAHPSDENFIKYFINAQKWSVEEGIEMFYFTSFDEAWKVGAEGDVGAHWGLWDENEKLKY